MFTHSIKMNATDDDDRPLRSTRKPFGRYAHGNWRFGNICGPDWKPDNEKHRTHKKEKHRSNKTLTSTSHEQRPLENKALKKKSDPTWEFRKPQTPASKSVKKTDSIMYSGKLRTIKGTPFLKTSQQLAILKDSLRCVKCGVLPDIVYTTKRCDHKYCCKCQKIVDGDLCIICDVRVPKTERNLFFCELVREVKNFSLSLGATVRKMGQEGKQAA